MDLNFKHLFYFWMVAKSGGVSRAAEKLQISPQTISGQLATLEREIGRSLLVQRGRRLELTEVGREALRYADEIFKLGKALQDCLADPALGQGRRLTVGIADSVAKQAAYQLLTPLLQEAGALRLICHEGEFDELVVGLARHKLDLVISDRDLGQASQLRLQAQSVARYPIALYASTSLLDQFDPDRSGSLPDGTPFLLPSERTSLRLRLDGWMAAQQWRPRVRGEFDDHALLTTFGVQGVGYFPAATVLEPTLLQQGVERVCLLAELYEEYFVLNYQQRLPNPDVLRLLAQAQS